MDGPLPPEVVKEITTGFAHLYVSFLDVLFLLTSTFRVANKYYVLASTVMLVYDHMLTFEVSSAQILDSKD